MMSEEEAFSAHPSNSITGAFLQQPHDDPNSDPNNQNPVSVKRKRSLPGTPDPDAEVIALSPKSLMATNRFICEICKKGFQRDQNLQLHRRGHNLPWKLKQRTSEEAVRKKVYVCPEKSCVHNDPSRALGDLTGIKKHFSRKHGEKKWNCDKCSKKYAVQSDWKAHTKICGTKEYTCHCGTLFSRKDSFITHRAFCEALAEQSVRMMTSSVVPSSVLSNLRNHHLINNNTAQATMRIPPPHDHHTSLLGFQQHEFGGRSVPDPLIMGNLSDHQTQKLKLQPLWLDQANSSHHPPHHRPLNNILPISNNNNNSSIAMPDLVQTMNMFGSSSSPQAALPWLMNYRYSSSEAAEAIASSSFASDNSPSNMAAAIMPVGGVMKREEQEENKLGDELLSSHSVMMSSFYSSSSSCQNTQGGPSHHMSATALLQKATQMESTRSRINDHTDNSVAFGFMGSSRGDNNNNDNVVEIQKMILKQAAENVVENTNNYDMVMNSSSFVIQDWGNPESNSNNNNNEDQLGLTRDFLGVGGDDDSSSVSRPFLQQQFAKFDSMGSVMNQFRGGHQR